MNVTHGYYFEMRRWAVGFKLTKRGLLVYFPVGPYSHRFVALERGGNGDER